MTTLDVTQIPPTLPWNGAKVQEPEDMPQSFLAILPKDVTSLLTAVAAPADPATPRSEAQIHHWHFALDAEFLAKVRAWIEAGKLRHEEFIDTFHDDLDGSGLCELKRWVRQRQWIRSDRELTSKQRSGSWTIKCVSDQKAELQYSELHGREGVIEKLKALHVVPDPKLNPQSPIAFVPIGLCAYETHRFSPRVNTVPRWWIDCAAIPVEDPDNMTDDPLSQLPAFYFCLLTVEMRYSLSGEQQLTWNNDDDADNKETLVFEPKNPRSPTFSKVITALALSRQSEKLLTRTEAEKLCSTVPPFSLEFATQ
jgi:hypothetical protein